MIPNSSINVIAQKNGLKNTKDEVLRTVTQEVEFRIRQIIQGAKKFMKHSKRKILTTEDINLSLKLKNVLPLYGYKVKNEESEKYSFVSVDSINDLYYIPDENLVIEEELSTPLEKLPIGPTITSHWLAINGVQPKIPQNPIPDTIISKKTRKGDKERVPVDGIDVDTTLLPENPKVKHVLSSQLILFYERVTETVKGNDDILKNRVFKNLKTNACLNQLVPYFVFFICEEVSENFSNVVVLQSLLELSHCLLVNPNVNIELNVNQLLPSLFSCCLGKTIGNDMDDSYHWEIRDFAAELIGIIFKRFGKSYKFLDQKIQKTFISTLLDTNKGLTTHYGALVGILELGMSVTEFLLFKPIEHSNLKVYYNYLKPLMLKKRTRDDAIRVESVLKKAAGLFFSKLQKYFKVGGEKPSKNVEEKMDVTDDLLSNLWEDEKDEEMIDENENEEGFLAKKEMKERQIKVKTPKNIQNYYNEMYKIFGDVILPHINYHIYEEDEEILTEREKIPNLLEMII